MDYQNDYDYFIDDRGLENEVGAANRAEFFLPQMTMYEIQTDPVKRFKVGVIQTVNQLVKQEIFLKVLIGFGDLERLIDMVDIMRDRNLHPEYKNPLGYVLGFMLIKQQQRISESALQTIKKKIPELQGGVRLVRLEDVLRYGFLWETLIELS